MVGLRYLTVVVAGFAFTTTPVIAADPAAEFLSRLFQSACLPNIGHPEKVVVWAANHKLSKVDNPAAISVYVGAGNGGSLWGVPSSSGLFALSIRSETKACAAWAGTADPNEVAAGMKAMMDELKSTGANVSVVQDDTAQMEFGTRHGLVYLVSIAGAPNRVAFTMLTNERQGGPYQATLQVSTVAASQ